MYPRTNYEMTQTDLDAILEACSRPAPVISFDGVHDAFPSRQENANRAWAALGEKMGFDPMTVQPISGKGNLFFSAIPSENETQRNERLQKEAEAKRVSDISRLHQEIDERRKALDILTSTR